MVKKFWILLCLYFGLVSCEKGSEQRSGFFRFPGFLNLWNKSGKFITPRTISMSDKNTIRFEENETGISIRSDFKSIDTNAPDYAQSDLMPGFLFPNPSENYYFQAGIKFCIWLEPENYANLPDFFDKLLVESQPSALIKQLYLIRFVSGIINQLNMYLLTNFVNETGVPDPKQTEVMQLIEMLRQEKLPKFWNKFFEDVKLLDQSKAYELGKSDVLGLQSIERLLQEKQGENLKTVLSYVQNALKPSSEGMSPSGGQAIESKAPAQPNSGFDPGLPS